MNDISRKTRREACRKAGETWDRSWQIFDEPNPNGIQKHRRYVVSVWRRYIAVS